MCFQLSASPIGLSSVDRAQREMDLLREYRTRLIADVVTGKLDVREAAARLPDEAQEPEPLDEAAAEADGDEALADDADPRSGGGGGVGESGRDAGPRRGRRSCPARTARCGSRRGWSATRCG